MLKNLLKYDLKDIYKVLVVFYVLGIFFAILTRVISNINDSTIIAVIGSICSGITISMIFSILINNIMRCFVRFRNNLYGDEAYLTHTLPVSKGVIYASKVLTSVITMLTSLVVIFLTIMIAYYSKENITFLKNSLLLVVGPNNSLFLILILVFSLFFLEMICLLINGYTGLIVGHSFNNNKLSLSILFGFIFYMVTQCFSLFGIFVAGLFNGDIMNLFTTNEMNGESTFTLIMSVGIIIYSIIILIYYFIDIKLLKKGVNVD